MGLKLKLKHLFVIFFLFTNIFLVSSNYLAQAQTTSFSTNLSQLQQQFNQDQGYLRLLILVSPT
jgi:regulatory protein YycI of two-component signal transduction system YycFG